MSKGPEVGVVNGGVRERRVLEITAYWGLRGFIPVLGELVS